MSKVVNDPRCVEWIKRDLRPRHRARGSIQVFKVLEARSRGTTHDGAADDEHGATEKATAREGLMYGSGPRPPEDGPKGVWRAGVRSAFSKASAKFVRFHYAVVSDLARGAG